jgi:hypothetical protein
MSSTKASGNVTAVLILAFACSSFAQGIKLGTNGLVSFATVEAARHILTNRDDFISALSPFDRAARMKTNREVTEEEFLEFAGRNVLSWLPGETNQVTAVLQTVRQRLAPWNLPFPSAIPFIKTSGIEEGNASYTRQNAVVLAQRELRSSGHALEGLIIHELFHVLSRHNPDLRKRLYRVVGFTPINDIAYPGELRPRKITNPDGVQSGWAINITSQNQGLSAVPILFASASRYDPEKGGEFFDYLIFKLLVVTNHGGSWQPKLMEGKPYLLEPTEAQGFYEQVGRNTDYIIHPDEILAMNFVHMINGETNLATPRIVAEMKKVFMQR